MRPREAIVTVTREVRKPVGVSPIDGNTVEYETVKEYETVAAKVWPVCMGDDKLLVEYEDGRLGEAEPWRIRMREDI